MRRSVFLLLLASVACAAPPSRLPLPVPVPPIQGATPVPANGAGVTMDYGTGVLGPELARSGMFGTAFGLGLRDAVSIWSGSARAVSRGSGRNARVSQLRFKARFAKPFGWRSALAVYGGNSRGSRMVTGYVDTPPPEYRLRLDTLQNDVVQSWDLAMPLEILLDRRHDAIRTSIFFGPRAIFARYDDRLRPDGTYRAVFPGAVGGVHASIDFSENAGYEVFFEGTLVYVPRHTYTGQSFGGRLAAMPAMGMALRIAPHYRW